MRIEFWSERSGEELARLLAPLMHEGGFVEEGYPQHWDEPTRWELDSHNDHKLDEHEHDLLRTRQRFVFRDRYDVEERLQRVEVALHEIGTHDLRRV